MHSTFPLMRRCCVLWKFVRNGDENEADECGVAQVGSVVPHHLSVFLLFVFFFFAERGLGGMNVGHPSNFITVHVIAMSFTCKY